MDKFNVSDANALTEKIIGCAIADAPHAGPGLLESIYRHCMVIEIRACGLQVETERQIGLTYRGQRVPKLSGLIFSFKKRSLSRSRRSTASTPSISLK